MTEQYKSTMDKFDPISMRHARIRYSIPTMPQHIGYIRHVEPIRTEDVYMDPSTGRYYMKYGTEKEWISVGPLVGQVPCQRLYVGEKSFDFIPVK
jgi:hypothetical protein